MGDQAMFDTNSAILDRGGAAASCAFHASSPGRSAAAGELQKPPRLAQYWIAVASAEHVRRGRAEGFMQVCHGKGAPLKRIKTGDYVCYYSPTATFGGSDRLQAFTAIGKVWDGDPYIFDMGAGFHPYRRDVAWAVAVEAPIKPLLNVLDFTAGKQSWGGPFRFGLFSVSARDFQTIAAAMGADLD
jgi:EVE domain